MSRVKEAATGAGALVGVAIFTAIVLRGLKIRANRRTAEILDVEEPLE